MKDRLFDGFEARELKAMLEKVTTACSVINDHAPVRLDVSGPEQTIALRTQGVGVVVGHGAQSGDTLTVRVHHNSCYPQRRELAEKVAAALHVEVG